MKIKLPKSKMAKWRRKIAIGIETQKELNKTKLFNSNKKVKKFFDENIGL
jgi:hypothetical protein